MSSSDLSDIFPSEFLSFMDGCDDIVLNFNNFAQGNDNCKTENDMETALYDAVLKVDDAPEVVVPPESVYPPVLNDTVGKVDDTPEVVVPPESISPSVLHDTVCKVDNTEILAPFENLYPPPLHDCTPFSNEGYMGQMDFEVNVPTEHYGKKNCDYSSKLHKLYVTKNARFPLRFQINDSEEEHLFIRVTPQYSCRETARRLVTTCLQHELSNKRDHPNSCHVIRCENKSTQYLGTRESNERLSIVFPLSKPQIGVEYTMESFYFLCMSSCADPGINRQPLELIFTLEDIKGTVIGRQYINVRICACPKRDKEKDEGKSLPTVVAQRTSVIAQKRRLELSDTSPEDSSGDEDTKVYVLRIPIVGKKNVFRVLDYIKQVDADEALSRQGTAAGGIFLKNRKEMESLGDTFPSS